MAPGNRKSTDAQANAAGEAIKHRRTRSIMAFAGIMVFLLALALAYVGVRIGQESSLVVAQQENESGIMAPSSTRDDPLTRKPRQTEVPAISALLGLTSSQALEEIGHGATVVDERDSSAGATARVQEVALTSERSTSAPTDPLVELGLDDAGRVRSAAYSVGIESLGYSSELSFRQAIVLMHVVENVLADAGVTVAEDAVALPQDSAAYSTYLSDGATVVREYAEFAGQGITEEGAVSWRASVEYNHEPAIESGNLADSQHIVSIFVES